jgi:hypothetical protein
MAFGSASAPWGNDRGKDRPDAPWYDELGGDRINDHDLTLADKRSARGPAEVKTVARKT